VHEEHEGELAGRHAGRQRQVARQVETVAGLEPDRLDGHERQRGEFGAVLEERFEPARVAPVERVGRRAVGAPGGDDPQPVVGSPAHDAEAPFPGGTAQHLDVGLDVRIERAPCHLGALDRDRLHGVRRRVEKHAIPQRGVGREDHPEVRLRIVCQRLHLGAAGGVHLHEPRGVRAAIGHQVERPAAEREADDQGAAVRLTRHRRLRERGQLLQSVRRGTVSMAWSRHPHLRIVRRADRLCYAPATSSRAP
jgi:hypothetical protein